MIFTDHVGNKVILEIKDKADIPTSKHVLIITNFKGNMLLTHNKIRGIEFPGGKVEYDETPIEAMHRELYEETGGVVRNYEFIGTYTVYDQSPFSKDVFYVEVAQIDKREDYLETDGPVIAKALDDIQTEDKSFLLKDDCILYLLDTLKERFDVHHE